MAAWVRAAGPKTCSGYVRYAEDTAGSGVKRSRMAKMLKIAQADALNNMEILVVLSDGRSLVLSLNGILGAEHKVLLPAEEDDDITYYPRLRDTPSDVQL